MARSFWRNNRRQRKIHLITIIGEVEGHANSSGSSKTTKYDHILPKLAEIEDDDSVDGLLVLLNTSGGMWTRVLPSRK